MSQAQRALVLLTLFSSFGQTFFIGLARGTAVSAFTRGQGDLQTWTGPMLLKAVISQVLAIPFSLAFLAFAAVIIHKIVD